MDKKIIVITGGNRGIGKATALALAEQGHTIILGSRTIEKTKAAARDIREQTRNKNIYSYSLDLGDPPSIDTFVRELTGDFKYIDILINNAGIISQKHVVNPFGFELTLAVNYMGPFYLTHRLLPLLQARPGARIINVSSVGHKFVEIFPGKNGHFLEKIDEMNKKGKSMKAYGFSKAALNIFTIELSRRLQTKNITVNALHPGHVATEIFTIFNNGIMKSVVMWVLRRIAKTPTRGAETILFCALDETCASVTGEYFINKAPAPMAQVCLDRGLQSQLYSRTCDMFKNIGYPVREV